MDIIDLMKALDAPIGMVLLLMLYGIRRDVKSQHKRINRIENRLFPQDDDATPPQGPGRFVRGAAVLFIVLLVLPGCDYRLPSGKEMRDGAGKGGDIGSFLGIHGRLIGELIGGATVLLAGHKAGRRHEKKKHAAAKA